MRYGCSTNVRPASNSRKNLEIFWTRERSPTEVDAREGFNGAGYGDRTRVRGLGSLCTTIVLSPHRTPVARLRTSRATKAADGCATWYQTALAADQRQHLVALSLHQRRRRRLEIEAQQRLGVRRPHVEVPVVVRDRQAVELVLTAVGEFRRDLIELVRHVGHALQF